MSILYDPANPLSGSPTRAKLIENVSGRDAVIIKAAEKQRDDQVINKNNTGQPDVSVTVANDIWTITAPGGLKYEINTKNADGDVSQYINNFLVNAQAPYNIIQGATAQVPRIISSQSSDKKNYISATNKSDTAGSNKGVAQQETKTGDKQYTYITGESIAAGSGKRFIGEPVNDTDTSTDNSSDTTSTDNDVSVTVDNSTAWTFTTPNGTVYTVPMAGLAWSDPAKMHAYITEYLASIGAPANVILAAVEKTPDVLQNAQLRTDDIDELKNTLAGMDKSTATAKALEALLDAKSFASLSPEDKFNKAKEYGLIPADAVYIPPDTGYNIGQNAPPGMPDDVAVSLGLLPSNEQIEYNAPNFNWAYMTKDEAAKYFAELKEIVGYDVSSDNLKQAIKEAREIITDQILKQSNFEWRLNKGYLIKLPNNEYMETSEFNKLSPSMQEYIKTNGIEAAKTRQAWAENILDKYSSGSGDDKNINIQSALNSYDKDVYEALQFLFPDVWDGLKRKPEISGATVAELDKIINSSWFSESDNQQEIKTLLRRMGYWTGVGGKLSDKWNELSEDDKQKVADNYLKNTNDRWLREMGDIQVTFANAITDIVTAVDGMSQSDKEITNWLVFSPPLNFMKQYLKPEAWEKITDWLKDAGDKVIQSQESFKEWIDKQPDATKIPLSAVRGIYDTLTAVGASIPLALMETATGYDPKNPTPSIKRILDMGAGLVTWPTALPYEIAQDPKTGIPYTVGLALSLVIGPKTILKLGQSLGRKIFIPKGYEIGAIRLDIDLPGGIGPEKMSEVTAHSLQNVLQDMLSKLSDPKNKGAMTDQIITDPISGATIRVTPLQRAEKALAKDAGNWSYSVDLNYQWLAEQIKKNGKAIADVPNRGDWGAGVYSSDSAWLTRLETAQDKSAGVYKPAIVAIKYNELKKVPKEVQELFEQGKFDEARSLFAEMERAGKIEPGAYEMWKHWVDKNGRLVMEREIYFAKGTEFLPIKPTFWNRTKSVGDLTASNFTWADRDLKRPDANGKETVVVKKGDRVPIIWIAAKGAKRSAPRLAVRQLSSFVYQPYTTLRRMGRVPKGKVSLKLGYGDVQLPELPGIEYKHRNTGYDYLANNEHPAVTSLEVKQIGGKGDWGTTVIGDLHGEYTDLLKDINTGYDQPLIRGRSGDITSWKWNGKEQSLVQVGDIVDRGAHYEQIRSTFNRLADEAAQTGGNVTRLIGNHELAYLTGEKIPGIDYSNAPTIRKGILDDISAGKLKAAEAINGELYTHAGVSLEKFPEWRGKDAAYIAADINRRFNKALEQNKWIDHIFDKGSGERGYKGIGGPFWLRTKETSAEAINLGYKQYFGHTPRPSGINEEASNAINVDIGRQWTESWPGKIGAYQHTPKLETVERGTNLIESLGESPVHGQGFMLVQFSLDIPTIEEGAISQTLKSLSRHDRGQIDWMKPEDIRVTMEPPTNLTPNQISAANRLIKSVWDKNGTVDMQFKGVIGISKDGMPAYNRQNILWQGEASLLNSNPKNPAYIAMPLVSKSQKLFENQREIDAGLKRLGINANYAEFRPAIILGKFKPKISMKDRMEYMEKVMKNQPKSAVMIRAEKVDLLKAKPGKNNKKSNETNNKLDENYDESRYDGSESNPSYTKVKVEPKLRYKPQNNEEYKRKIPADKLYYPVKQSERSKTVEYKPGSDYMAAEPVTGYPNSTYKTTGYGSKPYEGKDNTIETIPPPVIPTDDNQITKRQDSKAASEQDRPKLNNGDVAWKQGALGSGDNQRPVWYIQRADGDVDIVFQPPEDAPRLEGTPEETFFTRGKKPPTNLTQEMGITTAKIDIERNPEIRFVQSKAPKIRQSIPRHIRRSIGM
ncbi:hypothetical protein B1773_04475 [Dehalococcoides mccartyi]|uniref:metallophosphoesterase n=1 Tax=Dehalococcoides mccartyi TaxID=61435 RepID=UPI00098FE2F1|nr:metallophosphoesterase [Dehalococcoides mccartyi]AQU03301.1 hypothetical protein B1773_04475 [Dehalococcoides mccartyi]